MKRRSFFFALAAAAVVWGSGAGEARATTMLLSDLLGKTITINGLNFTFDSYTSNVAPATSVNVVFPSALSPGVPGFDLTAAFGALAGQNNDSDLVYHVTGAGITDVELTGNPQSSGTGIASVTETVHAGTSALGTVLGQIAIASNTTPGPVSTTFAAQTAITVVKDMQALGGSTGVALSSVTQAFSTTTVPEPASMGLLGIGMASFLAFRRLVKRRMPV